MLTLHLHFLRLITEVRFSSRFDENIRLSFLFVLMLDLNNGEVTADGAFGAFFFGNGGSPINDQPTSASK